MLFSSCNSAPPVVVTVEKDPHPGVYITKVRASCGQPDEFYPTPLVGRMLMTTFYKSCNGVDNLLQIIWPGSSEERTEIDETLSRLDMLLYTEWVSERDDKLVTAERVRFDTHIEDDVTIHAVYYLLSFAVKETKETKNEDAAGEPGE